MQYKISLRIIVHLCRKSLFQGSFFNLWFILDTMCTFWCQVFFFLNTGVIQAWIKWQQSETYWRFLLYNGSRWKYFCAKLTCNWFDWSRGQFIAWQFQWARIKIYDLCPNAYCDMFINKYKRHFTRPYA